MYQDTPNQSVHQSILKYRCIPGTFAICQLPADAPVPTWANSGLFLSITRNANELSIVCLKENVPDGIKADKRWICLKLEGPFSFSQTGVLMSFVGPLSSCGIPIFAISSYDTDYVLVKEEFAGVAWEALRSAGHELIGEQEPGKEAWRKPIE
jgi:uncharacterized protein